MNYCTLNGKKHMHYIIVYHYVHFDAAPDLTQIIVSII